MSVALSWAPGGRIDRPDPGTRLVLRGQRTLGRLEPLVDAADPLDSVRLQSRVLCAGLSQLALAVHDALGGQVDREEVAEAAALLALLTKIDDQVIDDRAFHGGRSSSRAAVRKQVRRYLAPTLASIQQGEAVEPSGRCALAADLGRRLIRLSGPDGAPRVDALLALVGRGWTIQEDAVVTLSADPSAVSTAQVDRVTRDISGAWLLMIARVGALGASRELTEDECEAVFDWGLHIQRADALADLAGDLADGMGCTSPGVRAWALAPERCAAALAEGADPSLAYALFAETGVDEGCLPAADEVAVLQHRLAGLGELSAWLSWIHGMLLSRYLFDPRCCRPRTHGLLAEWALPPGTWPGPPGGV